MLHTKLKGKKRRTHNMQEANVPPFTQPQSMGLGQKVKHFFLKVVMLRIKLNGNKFRTLCNQYV